MPKTSVKTADRLPSRFSAMPITEVRRFEGEELSDLSALLKDAIQPDKGHYCDHYQILATSFEREHGISFLRYLAAMGV
jgi:hypothetical protein